MNDGEEVTGIEDGKPCRDLFLIPNESIISRKPIVQSTFYATYHVAKS